MLVTAVVSFAVHYVTTPGESWFYACFSNTYADIGTGSDFYRDFARYAGYDLRERTMTFNAQNYCDPTRATFGDTYYQTLVALLDGGVLDVLVMEEDKLAAIGASGRLVDLSSTALMGDFAKRWQERLVYCQPYDETYSDAPVPVGIDLSGTALVGEYRAYADSAVLGISAHAPHMEQAEVFLNYLFEEATP